MNRYNQIKSVEEVRGAGFLANEKEYSKTPRGKELRKLEEEKEARIRREIQVEAGCSRSGRVLGDMLRILNFIHKE